MTVVRVATVSRYVGLAADSKPTAGVPAGSQFFETDTGVTFIYSGTAWGLEGGVTVERHERKTVTFANSSGTVDVFDITGRVRITRITAFVTVDVVEDGAVASIELGGATDPNALIVQTDPADLDANEWWFDASPVGGIAHIDALQIDAITDEDIILTITGGTDLDTGVIIFDVWFVPVTDNGALAAS